MLDELPPDLHSKPAVVVDVPLTQEDGSPRCARVPAALLTWREDTDGRAGAAANATPPDSDV